jgi:hypothetical protein
MFYSATCLSYFRKPSLAEDVNIVLNPFSMVQLIKLIRCVQHKIYKAVNKYIFYEINLNFEEWSLLGCYTMWILYEPTFRRTLAPPSTR